MISHLNGTLARLDLRYCIIDVNGVGYKVFITGGVVEHVSHNIGQPVTLCTYLAVRETALDLYGFLNAHDLEMFELLLTVSGIGPKSALGIMNIASTESIREAAITGDISYLTKVSGIGKKTAEKVVLELKEKIENFGAGMADADGRFGTNPSEEPGKEGVVRSSTGKDMDFAIQALQSLGYTEREARDAVKDMPREKLKDMKPEEIVREALKKLGS